jgi:hypothetical protein
MSWHDLLIDRNLSKDEVLAAMSQVFSVSPTDVLVVDDIAEAEVSEHIRLLCERMPVQGDFSMKLSIYVRDSELEQLDPKLIIRQFCCILHCQCLISDSSVNPYLMLLVQESGDIQPVSLNPDRLDENEEYIIIK